MLTIREYAKKNNISYEAVRKQVKRYGAELADSIVKKGRTKYLTDDAILFLDEKRKKNPVIVVAKDKDEQIEALKQENKNLLLQITSLQAQLIEEKEKVNLLQGEKVALLTQSKKNQISDEPPKDKSAWWKFWQ